MEIKKASKDHPVFRIDPSKAVSTIITPALSAEEQAIMEGKKQPVDKMIAAQSLPQPYGWGDAIEQENSLRA